MSAKTRPEVKVAGALALLFSTAINLINGGKRSWEMIEELKRALQLFKEGRLGLVWELGQTCSDEDRDRLFSTSPDELPLSRHAKSLLRKRGVRLLGEAFLICDFEGRDRNVKSVREIAAFLRQAGIPTGTKPNTCGWMPPYAEDPEILELWAKPAHELDGRSTCIGCQSVGEVLSCVGFHKRWNQYRLRGIRHERLYSLMVVPDSWAPPKKSSNCEEWGWIHLGELLISGRGAERLRKKGVTTFEELVALPVAKIRELCSERDIGRLIGVLRQMEEESRETPDLLLEWRSLLEGQLDKPINDFDFSVRTMNCLERLDIRLVGQLVEWSASELLKTKDLGRKSLREIDDALASINLELRPG